MPIRPVVRRVDGFAVHTLANDRVSVSLVPELGARVVSLQDLVSGREWLDGWRPAGERRLWKPKKAGDFGTGPGAGLDECLPTVAPCRAGRRDYPDHGELWETPAEPDAEEAARGALAVAWKLRSAPLAFARRISLSVGAVKFAYRIENVAEKPTPYLWAWHALFSLRKGDRLELSPAVKKCATPGGAAMPWPRARPGCDFSRADLDGSEAKTAKVFLGPLAQGAATLRDSRGHALALRWPAETLPHIGLWITRGGWNGLHHWAVEPTNARADALAEVFKDSDPRHVLAPREVREWTVVARVEPAKADADA